MKKELKKQLLRVDDNKHMLKPENFNKKNRHKLRTIKQQMEELLRHSLTLLEEVEDAPFFAELHIKNEESYELCIRFSYFGEMVTIFSENNVHVKKHPTEQIVKLLKKHGFVYIDEKFLHELYDGANKNVSKGTTWFERFFDDV